MSGERLSELVALYHGDCIALNPSPNDFAAVVTDPPYGMDWDTDSKRFSGGNRGHRRPGEGRDDWGAIHGDSEPFDPSPWLSFSKVVLFGANHFWDRLPSGSAFVWIKRNDQAFGSFLSDAEIAWVKGGQGVYCHRDLSMNAEAMSRAHPTQKPVGLMRWCIRRLKLPPGSRILDPYAGSGTTAIAAMLEGHHCTLIEKDAAHCETIRRRVKAEVDRLSVTLFGDLTKSETPDLAFA